VGQFSAGKTGQFSAGIFSNLIAIKIDSIYRIDESALRAFIESAQVNSVWK